jgi:hypothetical protein
MDRILFIISTGSSSFLIDVNNTETINNKIHMKKFTSHIFREKVSFELATKDLRSPNHTSRVHFATDFVP